MDTVTALNVFSLVCACLSIPLSAYSLYTLRKLRKAREANEAQAAYTLGYNALLTRMARERETARRAREDQKVLDFARRYGAVTPAKIVDDIAAPPRRDEESSLDPLAFGTFIASLPPMEETEIKIAVSDPGPEAWVGGGGDFSGGGASGSFDPPSSDTSSSSGSCGVE